MMTIYDSMAVGMLRVLAWQARYPYVRRKLERAVDHLLEREEDEAQASPLLFLDGFDPFEGREAVARAWGSQIN